MSIEAINPATGELLTSYEQHDDDEVARIMARAWSGFEAWRETTSLERADRLRRLAGVLEDRTDELARIATLQMGKPITEARAEVDKCAWLARHYADHGARYLEPDEVDTEADRSYVRFDPLGPILAVMPWNYPYWQVFRHAVPAATAGNVILLKHANNVLGVAHAIEDVLTEAGFPDTFLQALVVDHDQVATLVADDRVRGVTVTGSVGAGRAVAETAGRSLKKTVLELGGSDPFVVLPDADLDRAVEVGASARLLNSGQSCIAAKRFIVHDSVHDDYVERLAEEMGGYAVGDPLDEVTRIGPLAREDLRDELHGQVERSVGDGAVVVAGGKVPEGPGAFYPATVLSDLGPANPAATEELFGPVAAVMRFDDDEEAVAMANASPFGLGASIWSADRERAERLAADIDAGIVSVNQLVKSDPRLPFGGVKESGYGRELGQLGAREFTNAKTVWVE